MSILQTVNRRNLLLLVGFVAIIAGAIGLSEWLSTSPSAVALIEQFGYFGLVLLGTIGGLNFIIPIPPATFSALYSAAGLSTVGIILALAGGTLIADSIGFWFGTRAAVVIERKYAKIAAYAKKLAAKGSLFIIPFVALYAALVPFPNEAILIPLALTGIRFRFLIIPLLLGNILHQTILVIGVDTLVGLLF